MGYTTQLIRVPFRAFSVSGPIRPEAGGRWVGTKLTLLVSKIAKVIGNKIDLITT